MARWLQKQTKGYADVPKRLQWREGESRERRIERYWWLESNGLNVADYFAHLHAQGGPHPPARRRWLSREELTALDDEKDREEWRM
jgi:hypothetical protein